MAKSSGSTRKRGRPAGKSKKKSSAPLAVEGELKTTKKSKGQVIADKSERGIFDCPSSVHGIDERATGSVSYVQRISKDMGGMWATVEFGMTVPCAVTHFDKAQKWVRQAVDVTLDEEYDNLMREENAEEEAEGNEEEWR